MKITLNILLGILDEENYVHLSTASMKSQWEGKLEVKK